MAEENKQEIIELEEFEEDDLLDYYFVKALNSLKKVDHLDFSQYYFDATSAGENRFYQKNITETKHFDETWIKTLEGFFPSIDKIIKNPKMTIRYEEEVVAIEKAKKITSSSVRHLASHTQLIKEVDNYGNVKPKKILNTFAEEEIATYENRFIMTLINRLFTFVRARHEIIKANVESFQKDHLVYTSNFVIKDETVDFKIDVNIKRDLDNQAINKQNYELLARVERLATYVSGFKNSAFMKAMSKAKRVNPPIMKTNVILKNADFRNAYALWLFLDRYNSLGYDIDVRERPVRLGREFKSNLDRISAFSYAALITNKHKRQEDFRTIESITPTTKKSTKIVKTLIEDVVKRPDAIQVEDNLVNEYYLEQNKKVVNSTIKELIEQKVTKEAAAKKIVKESIQITNAMFDSVFNLEENIDYFEKYINEDDPFKDYDEAKFKLKIAKIIREAKEADYKRSIKLEKSLYRIMKKATNAKLRKANTQKKDEKYAKFIAQIEKEIKAYQKEKIRITALIEKLEGKVIDIATGKEQIVLEKEQFDAELKEEIKEIQTKAQSELNAEIAKLKKAHAEKMKKLEAELADSLAKAEAKKQARLARLREKYQAEIVKEKEKQRLLKEKEIARLKEQQRKELEKAKKEAEKKKKKSSTITEAEIKRKPKAPETIETVEPIDLSNTDSGISQEEEFEINFYDVEEDING